MEKLLTRIADYFKTWSGNDKTASKMEIDINEMREIAALNVQKCAADTKVKDLEKKYINGTKVVYMGRDESDDILCPHCEYVVAWNDCDDKPKHCPNCGAKLVY